MRLQSVVLSLLLSASAAFSADSALLNLVMPEARMVAGIDVERARNSYLGKKLLEQMDTKDSDFGKFVAMTGFDPRRDLREVIMATPDANTKNSPLILVRGVFDQSRINGFLKVAGVATSENLGGIDFYTKANSKEDMGFALIDSSLALAGSKDMVRAALKRRAGAGSAMTAGTYAKVQSLSRANDIWMVTSIPVAELSNAVPGGAPGPAAGMMGGDAFKGIEQAAMGVRFGGETMDLTAETISKTEKDATGIADIVRFLSTMVQMNRDKPEVKAFATALDAMKLTTDARTTTLMISLPIAEMDKMFNNTTKKAPAKKI